MVSSGSYVLSAIALLATVASLGIAAFHLRCRLLPAWQGAPARLVEIVLAVALLIWLCELLGLFGLLFGWSLAAVAVLLGGFALTARPPRSGERSAEPGPPRPPAQPEMTFVALVVVAVVFAHWGTFAKPALDHGMSNFDSLWYHMPFAAGIAQSHSVTGLHHTDTSYIGWFYTQNSELINAAGILLVGRDTLSIFLNFGWLGLAFLAAWCIGRPYGRAPLTVVAAAILLECNTLIVRGPGSAKNDTMTIALALAALAILLNAWAARRQRSLEPGWALAAAGLAAGLAVGTRLTVLPVAVGLSAAAIALVPSARRGVAAGWWLVGAVAGTGFWFLRNLVVAGNPMPQVTQLGPVSLPHPERLQPVTDEAAIVHYLTDTAAWDNYFRPGLHEAFGSLWPLVVGAAVVGAAFAAAWGFDRALRWSGVAALIGLVGYLVTPLGAAGIDDAPVNFWINIRYALPALLIGLLLLPLARFFQSRVRQWALLAALLAVLAITNDVDALLRDPEREFGLLLALAAIAIPALLLAAREWGLSQRSIAVGFAILTLLMVAIGYPMQRDYLRQRFNPGSGLPGYGLEPAYVWARDLENTRIALAGSTAAFAQYGFFGTDLSNRVVYLGEEGPHGAFNPIPDCDGFRSAVDAADPDYLVTSPFLNFINASEPVTSPEAGWLRGSRGVEEIDSNGAISIWRLRGRLGQDRCGPENAPLRFIPQQLGS